MAATSLPAIKVFSTFELLENTFLKGRLLAEFILWAESTNLGVGYASTFFDIAMAYRLQKIYSWPLSIPGARVEDEEPLDVYNLSSASPLSTRLESELRRSLRKEDRERMAIINNCMKQDGTFDWATVQGTTLINWLRRMYKRPWTMNSTTVHIHRIQGCAKAGRTPRYEHLFARFDSFLDDAAEKEETFFEELMEYDELDDICEEVVQALWNSTGPAPWKEFIELVHGGDLYKVDSGALTHPAAVIDTSWARTWTGYTGQGLARRLMEESVDFHGNTLHYYLHRAALDFWEDYLRNNEVREALDDFLAGKAGGDYEGARVHICLKQSSNWKVTHRWAIDLAGRHKGFEIHWNDWDSGRVQGSILDMSHRWLLVERL